MLTIGIYGIADRLDNQSAHDHALAIVRDGQVLASIELERVTGRKHDSRLGAHFEQLLDPWLVPGERVRFVQANSFLGASFATPDRSLVLERTNAVPLQPQLVPTSIQLRGRLAGLRANAFTVSHELAHVGSCLPFLEALEPLTLLVHIDGGASVSACSVWWWDGVQLSCVHHSWRDLKDVVNNFNDSPLAAQVLGIGLDQHLSMPGKLMGLAAYGAVESRLRSVMVENGYFLARRWRSADPFGACCEALGIERPPDPSRSAVGQNIAACLQAAFEESVIEFLATWKRRTGARHLCYAGGAALNVVANTRIENELGFETVTIPPVPSDCGLALGAAAIAEWIDGRHVRCDSPYLARTAPCSSPMPTTARDARELNEAAATLAAGGIVASIGGPAEAGPRGLGHRSLLARTDNVLLRRRLSEEMKLREWYRPVAPMMLREVAEQALEGFRTSTRLARFMLGAWRVAPAWTAAFAGCVHADGTVRAQIVDPIVPGQAGLATLLHRLRDEHDVHALINTSLNLPGAPMSADIAVAVRVAQHLGVDAIWCP
jgi:carbamoyltransferase